MSYPIVYPSSLPPPATLTTASAERRFLSAKQPFEARTFQRDRLALQDAVWPPLSAAEAAIFKQWFDATLIQGGRWFSSTWPLPQGLVAGTRRFMARPTWTYIAGGYWQPSAQLQVRGSTLAPVAYGITLLGMHMTSDFSDVSGHTLGPHHWTSGDTPPSIVAGLFGDGAYSSDANLRQPICSDVRGTLNLNQYNEWQISGFVAPHLNSALGYAGGSLLQLGGADFNGSSSGVGSAGGSTYNQFSLAFQSAGASAGHTRPVFARPYLDPSGSGVYDYGPLTTLGTPAEAANDVPTFFAICGDSTSTRLYLGTQLAQDDSSYPYPAGSCPLFYDPDRPFVEQTFNVGASFVGTYDDPNTFVWPRDWPNHAAWASGWSGQFMQLQVKYGLGAVDYHGTTIVPPTARFRP